MNKILKIFLVTSLAAAGASLFVACGDSNSTSANGKNDGVEDFDKLPACSLKNDAQLATVNGKAPIYVCKDRAWEILDTSFVANDTASTLDDIPECDKKEAGKSYFIKKSGVNYICEDGRWEIVIIKDEDDDKSSTSTKSSDSKGKSSSSAKSSDSKDNSSSSTKSSDSKGDLSSDSSVPPQPEGPMCGDKTYDPKVYECIDDKLAYFSCDVGFGSLMFYTDGKSVKLEVFVEGDVANQNGGCYAYSLDVYENVLEMIENLKGVTDEDLDGKIKGAGLAEHMYINGAVSLFADSCDYYARLTYSRPFDETFTEDYVLERIESEKAAKCSSKMSGDIRTCGDFSGTSVSLLNDPEAQFCWGGVTYDRCGGSSPATGKVYAPNREYCEDGVVKKIPLCGYEAYDPQTQMCDTREDRIYNIVEIGEQTWMAENLEYSKSGEYSEDGTGSWCYKSSYSNCQKYGRLYTWFAAVGVEEVEGKCDYISICDLPKGNVQGVCPDGWHVPRKEEFETLMKNVESYAALQAKDYENWPNATNESGFNAVPSGRKGYKSDSWIDLGEIAVYATATEETNYSDSYYLDYYYFAITADQAEIRIFAEDKDDLRASVRCVKD